MIINFRKRELKIELQEKEIQSIKKDFHKDIRKTVAMQKKVNKILSNGITFEIYQATGHKK